MYLKENVCLRPVPALPSTTATKCTMADKSTRTDDALLLNGDIENVTPCPPTTTNAATMTTVAAVQTEAIPSRSSVQIVAGGSANTRNHIHRQESRTDYTRPSPTPPPTVKFSFV